LILNFDKNLFGRNLKMASVIVPPNETSEKPAQEIVQQEQSKERKRVHGQFNWPIVGWLTLMHVGALAAPFFFSWQAVLVTVLLHWITGGIGICLGYHRLLTHRAFETYKPVRWLLALIGGLAGEGGAPRWIAQHRKHHAFSDKEGDPHSPHDGSWWSHVFWLAYHVDGDNGKEFLNKWAPDLMRDPVMRWLDILFLPSHFIFGGLLFAFGWWLGGAYMAMSMLSWGVFARLVFVLHSTWLVNSASHIWGYTNYDSRDDSRNNWWVALITYGEGWHNNHHAYPRMANHGHRWWEIDVTYWTINLMKYTGLAWNVVDYKRKHEQ
jgi:fatty-acid desaturase